MKNKIRRKVSNFFPYAWFEETGKGEIPFVSIDYFVPFSRRIGNYTAQVRIKIWALFVYLAFVCALMLFAFVFPSYTKMIGTLILAAIWSVVFGVRFIIAWLQCMPTK